MNNKMTKRRAPSPLMNSMGARVQDISPAFVSSLSDVKHSFEVSVDDLEVDPNQSRKIFDDDALLELAESLRIYGQLTPILVRQKEGVRGKWILVAGERRLRAAKLIDMPYLLAIERDTDSDVVSLIENLQREDLKPIEEAMGLKLLSENRGWSQRELARNVGKGVSHINGMLAVAKLPSDFLEKVIHVDHVISRNVLIEIARVTDTKTQKELCNRALAGDLTILAIREAVARGGEKRPTVKETDKQKIFSIKPIERAISNLSLEKIPNLSSGEKDSLLKLRSLIDKILGN
ncbi:ParB/RepB/Spo0J family partition protein (plasmid) [Acetobacter orientalis]|uniref:ParB/RepB/Spo0J family partition protein n=1 Tax=Acetobacter orientalis TaxID=146474 RepID=UPI0038647A4C